MRAHCASLAENQRAKHHTLLKSTRSSTFTEAQPCSVVTGDTECCDGRVVRGCSSHERGKIHVSDDAATLTSPSVGRHHGRARWSWRVAVMLLF